MIGLEHTIFEVLTPYSSFYPVKIDKSPACRSLDSATNDLKRIRRWCRQESVAGFAARIHPDSDLIVLDLESPTKKPGRLGPDGMMELCFRLDEHGITLPDTPTTTTGTLPNGGLMGCPAHNSQQT